MIRRWKKQSDDRVPIGFDAFDVEEMKKCIGVMTEQLKNLKHQPDSGEIDWKSWDEGLHIANLFIRTSLDISERYGFTSDNFDDYKTAEKTFWFFIKAVKDWRETTGTAMLQIAPGLFDSEGSPICGALFIGSSLRNQTGIIRNETETSAMPDKFLSEIVALSAIRAWDSFDKERAMNACALGVVVLYVWKDSLVRANV